MGLSPVSRADSVAAIVNGMNFIAVHTDDPGNGAAPLSAEVSTSRVAISWVLDGAGRAALDGVVNVPVPLGVIGKFVSFWNSENGGVYRGSMPAPQITSNGNIPVENVVFDQGAGEAVTFMVANQSIARGALTQQGHAAHSFNASGSDPIASIGAPTGANVADLNVSFVGGVVTVEPAGNGLPNGPYSITIPCFSGAGQSGEKVDVTYQIVTTADEFSVSSEVELQAVLASASSNGKSIRLAGITYPTISLTGYTKTASSVVREAGAEINKLDLSGVSGITFDGLYLFNDTDTGADDSTATNGTEDIVYSLNSACTFQNNEITCGDVLDKRRRYGGIRVDGGNMVITNNDIHHINDGLVCNGATSVVITGNSFSHVRVDAITGKETYDWHVEDNTGTYFQGELGKRFYYTTSSGTINPGDFIRGGTGPDNYVGIYVVSVTGTYIDGYYNGWEKPDVSDRLTVVGGSAYIDVDSITTEFDGTHGDFCQPLLNDSAGDVKLTFINNFVYRSTPYSHGELDDEAVSQGLLMQANGSMNYYNPVNVSGNVIASGQPGGMTVGQAKNGRVAFNTVLTTEYSGADSPTRLRVSNADNIIAHYNTADGAGNGVVDGGGNTNVTIENNVDVPKASFDTVFADPLGTPPLVLADFAPEVGQSVDTGDAGALTTGGAYKTLKPVLYGVSIATNATGCVLSYSADINNGTVYLLMDQNPTRTAAQIEAGGGTDSDSASITSSGSQTDFTLTGGSASTSYYYHIVHKDSDDNYSDVIEAQFTTDAASATFGIVDTDTVLINSGVTTGDSGTLTPDGTGGQILFVCVTHEGSVAAPPSVSSVSFDGSPMSEIYNDVSSSNFLRQAIYALPIGSSSTSGVATVNFTGILGSKGAAISSFIASGLNQSAPAVSTTINAGNQTYPVNLDDTVNGDGVAFGFWSTGIFTSGGYDSEGAPTIDIDANNGSDTASLALTTTYREFDVGTPTAISQTVGLGGAGTANGSRDIISSVIVAKL